MVWSGVVFATSYLLMQLGDDLCDAAVVKGRLWRAHPQHPGAGRQAAGSGGGAGLGRAAAGAVFFHMVVALMAPLGWIRTRLFRRGSSVDHSLRIGDITLAPQACSRHWPWPARFLAIRLLKHWLRALLSAHHAGAGHARTSIVTLLGYTGAVVVVAVALAGLGISVERIAWVASALTVGIGFGLQAIVQKLHLRPDPAGRAPGEGGRLAVLGDTEGDVRRVNVRATEIQQSDRSTVIVPNSEFIHQDRAQRDPGQRPGPRAAAPTGTTGHRRAAHARADPAGLGGHRRPCWTTRRPRSR